MSPTVIRAAKRMARARNERACQSKKLSIRSRSTLIITADITLRIDEIKIDLPPTLPVFLLKIRRRTPTLRIEEIDVASANPTVL